MKRILVIAGVVVLTQAILVGLYTLLREAPLPAGVTTIERPAPEIAYRTLSGSGRLSELRGQPVLVHFWATWCPPCREELPSLLAWAKRKEIAVLAVSVDPDWKAVRRFLGRLPPPAIVLARPEVVSKTFGVLRLPESYVVDGNGILRLRLPGPQRWSDSALRAAVLGAGSRGP